MGLAVDALFFIAAFATPVAVCIGMLAEGKGSVGTKLSTSFTWHPILMSLAFSFFMVLGRWAYVTDSLGDKPKQRPVHRALMILGALCAVGGYVAIFVAHVQKPTFFGYNFHTQTWAVPTRVIHDLFGYGILLLTLAQASMGLQKLVKLNAGMKRFTFHGDLGKAILLLASVQIVIACIIWPWATALKILTGVFAVGAALCGAFYPKQNIADEDARSLARA
eukprot:Skav213269  [mRNA]  locus=scaffold2944:60839:61501:+ [translate_table: standard]